MNSSINSAVNRPSKADEYILAGDIGGTNANFALVSRRGGRFLIEKERRVSSDSIEDFSAVTAEAAAELSDGIRLSRCCICAAGVVKENSCRMTNQTWTVDGNALETVLGIPTVVINDFLALSYSLPLLDITDPQQVLPLPHPDGTMPAPRGSSFAIIGAGTGLGVAHLIKTNGSYTAVPSEGGHTDFPAFDKETQHLGNYLKTRYDSWPGTECVLSGQGMANIYAYVRSSMSGPADSILEAIDKLPEKEQPAEISRHGETHPQCRQVMEILTRIYGKFAGNMALNFLPEAGLFLAGGIAQKNIKYLLKEERFMRYFESNYNPKLREAQHGIPVYLIREYSISLLGAAHAAVILT